MSQVGNDNIVDIKNVIKSNVSKRGFFSGNFSQIIVLLNGMILTIAAFISLGIYVERIMSDDISNLTLELSENITHKARALEDGVASVENILSISKNPDSAILTENFANIFYHKKYFKDFYWMQQDPQGRYIARKLYSETGGDVEKSSPSDLERHQKAIKSLSSNHDKTQIITQMDNQTADGEFIIGRRIKMSDDTYNVIYGTTSFKKMLESDTFFVKNNLIRLDVVDKKNQKKLFLYDLTKNNPANSNELIDVTSSVSVMNMDVGLSYVHQLNDRQIFIKKLPVFALIIGSIFTIIGTLYVRSNHVQSMKLAKMNIDLAENNERLNKEIQEREKLNHTIRRQDKDNRAIIDSVSDIIFETNTDGKILFLNDTWQKITGFSIERSLGRNLFDLLYTQDQAEQKNNMALLVKGKKQSYRAFTRLRTAEGTFRSVELAISMLRQDDNRELRVVGTIMDVEERRRAEKALSEAEKKYRAIVENAASGIYQVTPEGQYLSANPAMNRILGYGSNDDLLKDIHNANLDVYFDPREREKQLRDAVRHGHYNFETQVRKKDQTIIWINESLRAVKDDNDQIIYFEGSIEDITLRKEAEIALKDAKIESDLANRAKSEFLANMSHELRTPLNAVIGFSEIIYTQAFGEVGRPEYLEYSKEINNSGKRLLGVINDILDVSRIEAGDRQLNEGIVDLNKIVLASLEILSSKIEQHKTTVTNHLSADTPKIIGESHAIKQIIVNLLSNAVKFTPDGGRVSINAELDTEGHMHVSITDTGIGLTDDEIEIAMSPFGQVNTSLSKGEAGTGLGLTLVKSLISLHGGSFELFSQKGIGTTATLVFPTRRVSHNNHVNGTVNA